MFIKVLQFVFKYKLMMKTEDLNSDATVDDEALAPNSSKTEQPTLQFIKRLLGIKGPV